MRYPWPTSCYLCKGNIQHLWYFEVFCNPWLGRKGRLREVRCFHNVWVQKAIHHMISLRAWPKERVIKKKCCWHPWFWYSICRSKTVLRNMYVDESFWPPIPIIAELSATISTARLLKRNEFAFYLNADSNNPQPWFHTSNSVMVSSLSSDGITYQITVSQKKNPTTACGHTFLSYSLY